MKALVEESENVVEESENEFEFEESDNNTSHDDESDNSHDDESDTTSHDDELGNHKVSLKSRKNKNAPAELSSKKSVSRKRVVVQVKNTANKVSTLYYTSLCHIPHIQLIHSSHPHPVYRFTKILVLSH